MTSIVLPVSFLSAADGQTESRMYWSFETPCSFVAVSIHLSKSGLPCCVDDAGQLRRVGDFGVEVLLGDRRRCAFASACCSSRCEISTSSTSSPYRSRHSSASSCVRESARR